MNSREVYLTVILMASGCAATAPVAESPPPAQEEPAAFTPEAMVLRPARLEADHLEIVVPLAWRDRVGAVEGPLPERGGGLRIGALDLVSRESPPEVTYAGEALSVIAEGIVKVTRTRDRLKTEEGPFRTLIWRNGRMMSR